MNNRELAHAFAQRQSGSSSTALTIRYPTIYSYATPIARHGDENTVAVNPNRYSVTTSGKHQGPVRAALSQAGYRDTGERIPQPHEGRYDPAYQDDWEVWRKD
jgi:hypothetical protein